MASRKFPQFPLAESITDEDLILIWQSGTNKKTTAQILRDGIVNSLDLPSGERVLSSSLVILSDTAGEITAEWVDNTGTVQSVVDEPVTFIGAPSAGNFRFDIIEGLPDGTVNVVSGSEGGEGVVTIPSNSSPDALTLITILWDSDGELQEQPPTGNPNQNVWSLTRFVAKVSPNTTNKFAKIWEGNLSRNNNYGIDILYNDPRNASNFNGSGQSRMKVSWTCDNSRNIIADTVKFFTDADGEPEQFRLVQITGNKAALYHKGSHYWSRIDFRVVFQSSAVRLQDFVNGGVYGSAPSSVATFDSQPHAGGSGGGGGLEIVDWSSVIDPSGNFRSFTIQSGAIAYTRGSVNASQDFGNKTIHFIEPNGTGGKPTFSGDFVIQYDNWGNSIGMENMLTFVVSPNGDVLVWLERIR